VAGCALWVCRACRIVEYAVVAHLWLISGHCGYYLAMTGEAGHASIFTLEYEVQPGDLREIMAGNPRRRQKRRSVTERLALWVVLAVVVTAIAVEKNSAMVGKDSTTVTWVFALALFLWIAAATTGLYLWRSSPRRLARRAWQKTPEFHGRTRDHVESAGIRSVYSNGTEHFHPWGVLTRIQETDGAFHLLDANGRAQVALPKRGLERPDQLPALREYLNRVVNEQPLAAPASTAAGEPQP
jgi:hypothetical protein